MSETTEKTTDQPHEAEVRTYQTSQGPRYAAVVSFQGARPWRGPTRSTWKAAKDDESVMIARGELGVVQTQRDNLRELVDRLEGRMKAAQADAAQSASTIEDLEEQLEEAERSRDNFRGGEERARAEVARLQRERDEALAALADHGVDGLPPADGVRTLAGCVESVKSAARLARQAADTKRAEAKRLEEELDAAAQALGCGRAGILEAIEDLKTAREALASEAGEANADCDRAEEELDAVCSLLGCERHEAAETLRRVLKQVRDQAAELRRVHLAFGATFTSANALLNALATMEGL